jgi:hypothetical protein
LRNGLQDIPLGALYKTMGKRMRVAHVAYRPPHLTRSTVSNWDKPVGLDTNPKISTVPRLHFIKPTRRVRCCGNLTIPGLRTDFRNGRLQTSVLWHVLGFLHRSCGGRFAILERFVTKSCRKQQSEKQAVRYLMGRYLTTCRVALKLRAIRFSCSRAKAKGKMPMASRFL